MNTSTCYIQHSYPSFLSSYTRNNQYLNDSISQKQIQSDNEDDNQSLSPSINGISFKKRSRTIPDEEKDAIYYEKRARNNDAAKRSRDTRRIKEQQIEERVSFLEHENSRLAMENQAMRYQLSQLHTLCTGVSKPLQ